MAERDSVYYYSNSSEVRAPDTADTSEAGGSQQLMPEHEPQISMKRTEVKSGSVLTIILVSVIAFMLLGSVIYSLDRRNTVYNEVADLNSKLTLAEAENVRLHSELESRMSAKNVEEYAENVLGMQKIDSSQIKYIKIRTDDVVNIPEQKKGILSSIRSFFEECVEYFRG